MEDIISQCRRFELTAKQRIPALQAIDQLNSEKQSLAPYYEYTVSIETINGKSLTISFNGSLTDILSPVSDFLTKQK